MSAEGGSEAIEPAEGDRARTAFAALEAAGAVGPDDEPRELVQLEGGWSRHSYSLAVATAGGRRREFIVRVKPPGALLETEIAQEYATYRLIGEHQIKAPAVHALDDRLETPFGGPFLIMDRAPGRAPNVWRRGEREALEANWGEGGSLARDLVETLVAIHTIPLDAVEASIPRREFAELIAHWRGVHEEMALVRDPVAEDAYEWLLARPPEPVPATLVHGDYRIGNCLIEDGRITAVLDWELAYCGDPRFDLGYVSLDYLAGKFTRPGSQLLGGLAEREWFFTEYERRSGQVVDREVVRTFSVLGALVLIAILHTGVRMYADRRTDDVRMVWSRFAIPGLRQDLTRLMEW